MAEFVDYKCDGIWQHFLRERLSEYKTTKLR